MKEQRADGASTAAPGADVGPSLSASEPQGGGPAACTCVGHRTGALGPGGRRGDVSAARCAVGPQVLRGGAGVCGASDAKSLLQGGHPRGSNRVLRRE